jgi:hypothetical protein
MDDNEEILNIIKQRLQVGQETYGHGIRVNDDTRQWGTKNDSWGEMGLEEILDLTLYLAAQILRYERALEEACSCHNCDKCRA